MGGRGGRRRSPSIGEDRNREGKVASAGTRRERRGNSQGTDHMEAGAAQVFVGKGAAGDITVEETTFESPNITLRRANPNANGRPPAARTAGKSSGHLGSPNSECRFEPTRILEFIPPLPGARRLRCDGMTPWRCGCRVSGGPVDGWGGKVGSPGTRSRGRAILRDTSDLRWLRLREWRTTRGSSRVIFAGPRRLRRTLCFGNPFS